MVQHHCKDHSDIDDIDLERCVGGGLVLDHNRREVSHGVSKHGACPYFRKFWLLNEPLRGRYVELTHNSDYLADHEHRLRYEHCIKFPPVHHHDDATLQRRRSDGGTRQKSRHQQSDVPVSAQDAVGY